MLKGMLVNIEKASRVNQKTTVVKGIRSTHWGSHMEHLILQRERERSNTKSAIDNTLIISLYKVMCLLGGIKLSSYSQTRKQAHATLLILQHSIYTTIMKAHYVVYDTMTAENVNMSEKMHFYIYAAMQENSFARLHNS